jgi:pyruvate, water dikinase
VRLASTNQGKEIFPWSLTFEKLLSETSFVERMREMLALLQQAYQNPVDVEFTATFQKDGTYSVNLVQCRPTLVIQVGISVNPSTPMSDEQRVLESRGPVIGQSREMSIDRLIYVVPSLYGELLIKDRYTIAKLVGELTRIEDKKESRNIMLLGPGRWGTTTPSLGVPISFVDIKKTHAVCEIVTMREGLTPDVSLGTHFFNELVETDILYFALYPERAEDYLNTAFLESAPNRLSELLPDCSEWASVVRVLDTRDWKNGKALRLVANAQKQRVVCYREV